MRNEQEQEVDHAHSGETVAFKTTDPVRPGDKIFRVEFEGQ
jgi:hypothetical protein